MDENIRKLKELVDGSDNIVFFGGAGVSTESGIPDFRSVDGLYHQKFRYPPETMLSHTFFEQHTGEFFDFYRAKMLALDAQPNAAHRGGPCPPLHPAGGRAAHRRYVAGGVSGGGTHHLLPRA